jgi:hypothetical protein
VYIVEEEKGNGKNSEKEKGKKRKNPFPRLGRHHPMATSLSRSCPSALGPSPPARQPTPRSPLSRCPLGPTRQLRPTLALAPAPPLACGSRPSAPSSSPVRGINAITAGCHPFPLLAITRATVKFGTDSSHARCDRVPACHRLHRAIPSPPLCHHYRRRCAPRRCPPASAPPLPPNTYKRVVPSPSSPPTGLGHSPPLP